MNCSEGKKALFRIIFELMNSHGPSFDPGHMRLSAELLAVLSLLYLSKYGYNVSSVAFMREDDHGIMFSWTTGTHTEPLSS